VTIAVAVAGGSEAARVVIEAIVDAAPDIELLAATGLDLADVVLVAGGGDRTLLDRCRSLAAEAPCVVLLDGPASVEAVTAAMGAGARGVVASPPEAFALLDAVRAAAVFGPGRSVEGARGRVVVVAGARGGTGTTTVALALARSLVGPIALIDLDVAGGTVAADVGLGDRPASPGLAGEASGRRAWQRLAVGSTVARVVAAPCRPTLAWLIREGVPRELIRAAAAESAHVVVDAGRVAGPAVEAVREADVLIVVAAPTPASVGAAAAFASELADVAPAACRTAVVISAPSPIARLLVEAGRLRHPDVTPVVVAKVPAVSRPVPRRLATMLADLVGAEP
jgi:pilus assembly protein CpaE